MAHNYKGGQSPSPPSPLPPVVTSITIDKISCGVKLQEKFLKLQLCPHGPKLQKKSFKV